MNPEPVGFKRCVPCDGTGKAHDETPCASCGGTGLLKLFTQPADTRPAGPTRSSERQRRFPRYYADLPLTIRDQRERELVGRCVVIAEGGLAAVLIESIPAGSVVALQLPIPKHANPLVTWAVVRNQVGPRHGFEFISLTEPEREALRQFCNRLLVQSVPSVDS